MAASLVQSPFKPDNISLSMARGDYSLFHPLRVRWAEVDRQGVVFNGHYFTYFDVAVTEYWRTIGFPYPEAWETRNSDVLAVKAGAEYRAPAEYDDQLEIGCRVGRIGRTSLTFRLGVFRGTTLLTVGELVYVNIDMTTRQPIPWPETLVIAIGRLEILPPEA